MASEKITPARRKARGKNFLILMESRVQPQRRLVQFRFFLQMYYQPMYLFKKIEKSSPSTYLANQ
jgi:hypothetical protein